MMGILPIMTTIDQAKLALFHNMWIKPNNEMTKIMYNILNDASLKKEYWIRDVNNTLEYYDIPGVNELKKLEPKWLQN